MSGSAYDTMRAQIESALATVTGEQLAQGAAYHRNQRDALLDCAETLAGVANWSVAMEEGADGFDNTEASHRYAEARAQLLAAMQAIACANRILA